MKQTYTQKERDLVFDLWKQGAGFSDISRMLDTKPGSISTILRKYGGIKPEKRKRTGRQLNIEEREEIRASLSAKMSIRAIANRSTSTISREVNRNRGRRWYKALDADRRAWSLAKQPKPCALAANDELRELVAEKLQLNWSPEQISGWLKVSMSRHKATRDYLQNLVCAFKKSARTLTNGPFKALSQDATEQVSFAIRRPRYH